MANKEFKIELSNEKIKPLLDKLKLWCEKGQLEPRNYEVLSNMITKCENYDDAISILEIATQSRKTGLFYRHQFEKVPTNKIHFLEEDTKMSFGKKGSVNKLIIGDNYLALKNLLVTYRGKIDVIYIDPPYGCNDMGEFADTNYENNITRDNLLSQFAPRFELAQELLSDEGVIFVSIDDKNHAYVKCLMDDIFGEQNFVSCCIRRKNKLVMKGDKTFKCVLEPLLVYAKKKSNLNFEYTKDEALTSDFSVISAGYGIKEVLFKKGQLNFKIQDGKVKAGKYPSLKLHDDIIIENYKNANDIKISAEFKWSQSKIYEKIESNAYILIKKIENMTPRIYFETSSSKPLDYIDEHYGRVTNEDGKSDLKKLGMEKLFVYPKPLDFIKFLLNIVDKKDAIVLDFYAGSGTTGHAVLEQNKKDAGQRTFILCTNEDKGTDNQYPNGIGSDVTFERLKRVMTGKASDGSKFKWAEENEPYGQTLKVYRIAEVENTNKDVFKLIDPKNYDYPCSTEKKKIEWICKNFEETQKILKEKK